MRILCIDVGRGTQDILFYDSTQRLENCCSLVLPSPVVLAQKRLEAGIRKKQDVLFYGTNMGGFPLEKYVAKQQHQGRKIWATPEAAATFADNLEEVVEAGVELVDMAEAERLKRRSGVCAIRLGDVDLEALRAGFAAFGVEWELDGLAVAVQDHGAAPPGVSDRRFRFEFYARMLEQDTTLLDWAYAREDIPERLTRMQAVADALADWPRVVVMDTGMAAVLGCLEDEAVREMEECVVLNVGNGHTLAVYLRGERVVGLWEHHTSLLDAAKIGRLVEELVSGTLDGEAIFAELGHGGYLRPDYQPPASPPPVFVTGPNRELLHSGRSPGGGRYHFVSPHGNMMLTGAYGLLRAYLALFGGA